MVVFSFVTVGHFKCGDNVNATFMLPTWGVNARTRVYIPGIVYLCDGALCFFLSVMHVWCLNVYVEARVHSIEEHGQVDMVMWFNNNPSWLSSMDCGLDVDENDELLAINI